VSGLGGTGARLATAVVGAVLLAWIGWVTIQTTRVDLLANSDPVAALRIDPDHPQALLALGRRQLREGDTQGATATARHVLTISPGRGDAFAILALAAARRGDADSPRLLAIALQRAPRDRDVRVQAALQAMKSGDLRATMAQLDALLKLSPERGTTLYPLLAKQAEDPRFAAVLAETLARNPPWRRGFLVSLSGPSAPALAADNINGWLASHGKLTPPEIARWLDRILADGRWGDAFGRWVGTLGPGHRRIPAVRNGGFEEEITDAGFDWRNDQVPGVLTDIEEGAGLRGSRAAHLHFIGRSQRGNLRQPLLLAPGRYRLSLHARGDFLKSDQGLQWVVRCEGGPIIAAGDRLDGSFDWRLQDTPFEVPATQCNGQWLELQNPAVAGAARQVSGDLWFDDISISPEAARP
jgi:hypothetical protein